MGICVDKQLLKLDKPVGNVYVCRLPSDQSCWFGPSNIMRADEITNKTAKNDKVTAIVDLISIFVERKQFAEH